MSGWAGASHRTRAPALQAILAVATAGVVVGVAFLVLFNPPVTHAALRQAGSASILGLTEAQTEAVSDRTLGEMALGPGTFAFSAVAGGERFYDEAEASHLRDARTVMYLFLGFVALSAVALVAILARRRGESWAWRGVAAGGLGIAIALATIGVVATVAFDQAFTLFHEIFFPGGNWEFSLATERMVQLYPTPFWELVSTLLAILTIGIGLAVWYAARGHARRIEARNHGLALPGARP